MEAKQQAPMMPPPCPTWAQAPVIPPYAPPPALAMPKRARWTGADEAALREADRRLMELKARRDLAVDAVKELVELMDLVNLTSTADFAQILVAHADELRDLLAPFDSGVREG